MTTKNDNYLFSMIWGVDRGGYDISEGKIIPRRQNWKTYDPFLDDSGLARKFSKIPVRAGKVQKEEALLFANRYGLLGLDNSYGMEGENLEDWVSAIYALRDIFSQIKKGDQEEALYSFNGSGSMLPMRLAIANDGSPWQRSLRAAPVTLYGALWLMAAKEIVAGAQFKPCKAPGCPELFPIRSNKNYCSDACKQAAYRERKG